MSWKACSISIRSDFRYNICPRPRKMLQLGFLQCVSTTTINTFPLELCSDDVCCTVCHKNDRMSCPPPHASQDMAQLTQAIPLSCFANWTSSKGLFIAYSLAATKQRTTWKESAQQRQLGRAPVLEALWLTWPYSTGSSPWVSQHQAAVHLSQTFAALAKLCQL